MATALAPSFLFTHNRSADKQVARPTLALTIGIVKYARALKVIDRSADSAKAFKPSFKESLIDQSFTRQPQIFSPSLDPKVNNS